MGYIRGMKGTDPDLAAHFTILRKYGITLAGEAVEEVFGKFPGRRIWTASGGMWRMPWRMCVRSPCISF